MARSVELTVQVDEILRIGPVCPVTLDDLQSVRRGDLGNARRVAGDLHRRLTEFVHRIVVYRRDEAIRGWRNLLREDPCVHPHKWLRPDLVLPALFLQCEPHLTPGGSGVLADPVRIDEEFRKAWLPYFCRSGQREASLEEFAEEVKGWLPLLPEISLPKLTGEILADVVRRQRAATAGSLDKWRWRELKALLVAWYDQLARILSKVEENGVWPEGLLDAKIAMFPEADRDAPPLGRPLSVLVVVCRLGLLPVWCSLMIGSSLGCLTRSLVLVVVGVRLRFGILRRLRFHLGLRNLTSFCC